MKDIVLSVYNCVVMLYTLPSLYNIHNTYITCYFLVIYNMFMS